MVSAARTVVRTRSIVAPRAADRWWHQSRVAFSRAWNLCRDGCPEFALISPSSFLQFPGECNDHLIAEERGTSGADSPVRGSKADFDTPPSTHPRCDSSPMLLNRLY